MTVLATVRSLVALGAEEADGAEFMRPAAEFDELAMRRLRKQVAEARQELREAGAAHTEAETALANAIKPLERVAAAIEAVEPAEQRASLAEQADAHARRAAFERGGSIDSTLADVAETAHRELRGARRAETAAREALPGLEQRVTDAREAVKQSRDRIDQATARVLVTTLAERNADAAAAAARLGESYLDIASLCEMFLRARVIDAPRGSVPEEMVPRPPPFQFATEELQPGVRQWQEFAKRLRSDPEASF